MNILTLTLANIRYRALTSFFNVLILALGIAMIITLLHVSRQIEDRFTRDLQGIDLVVGAKGSPLQLILSSVFHLDVPNGNIPLEEAQKLEKNPLIKTAIPLALGDNYEGYRIVGTTPDYIAHYGGTLAQGRVFSAPMEAVLGSDVAHTHPLKLGERIIGAHGLSNSNDFHSDFPYTIVGTLAPTGTVLDRLVLTPVQSVWHVHAKPDADNPEEIAYKKAHPEKEITALLISYQSPYAAVVLPRMVNKTSAMQAASPAFEMAQLMHLIGIGSSTIAVFSGVLMGIAAIGFFITLFNAVNERRYDIALMRSLGATRRMVVGFVLVEGLMLGLAGTVLGVVLGHGLALLLQIRIEQSRHMALAMVGFVPLEWYVLAGAMAISVLAAMLPAAMVYRIHVAKILARGS